LERVLREWVAGWGEEQAYALDGKTLRGSKRQRGEEALQLVTMAGQHLRGIVGQYRVEGQDELEAALRMIEEIPLAGKVVSADAGLLRAPLVQKVVKKGAYIGFIAVSAGPGLGALPATPSGLYRGAIGPRGRASVGWRTSVT